VAKTLEIRDPIHVFVRVFRDERDTLIDSIPFQRLRDIHQLAMTYLVYPGASHRRFEHSLGVMELATSCFDRIVAKGAPDNVVDDEGITEELNRRGDYWRSVVRAAALCHDMGHTPFSHAAEELLPDGKDHETITGELILSNELQPAFERLQLDPEAVARVALGHKQHGRPLKPIESVLTEIITGDAFGADRMDYLLRDSHHTGVAYGRFDHNRLIDTLCLVRSPAVEDEREEDRDIQVGAQ